MYYPSRYIRTRYFYRCLNLDDTFDMLLLTFSLISLSYKLVEIIRSLHIYEK